MKLHGRKAKETPVLRFWKESRHRFRKYDSYGINEVELREAAKQGVKFVEVWVDGELGVRFPMAVAPNLVQYINPKPPHDVQRMVPRSWLSPWSA